MRPFTNVLTICTLGFCSLGATESGSGASTGTAVIRLGDGAASKGDLNGKTLPLAQAIAALPPTGGLIEILPGAYTTMSPALVLKPNVTICGAGASTQIEVQGGKSNAKGKSDFVAIGPDAVGFTLRDCALTWKPGEGDCALVLCEAASARIRNCHFIVETKPDKDAWGTCINVQGEAGPRVQNVWIESNQFDLASWVRGVRLDHAFHVYAIGNAFNGRRADPGQCLLTSTCNFQQFSANTFLDVGSHDGPYPSYGLLMDNPGGDMGHAEITGNHFHTIFGQGSRGLKLGNAYFTSVAGNVFGRVQGIGNTALEVAGGHGITISGNQIENSLGGGGSPVLLLKGASGISVTSNVFADNYGTEIELQLAEKPKVSGVTVQGNTISGQGHPHPHGILVSGRGAEAVAIANNILDHHVDGEAIAFEPQDGLTVAGNLILAPMTKAQAEEAMQKVKPRFTVPGGQSAPTR